ncbi:MAG: cysteine desulfurase, partial [Frankiales bacterium]|nr:cysteine desulfurase [Frankiales bacterium]
MAYLDHAASTPMLPEAVATVTVAVTAALSSAGNASSLHTAGRRARRVVEESREQLAAALGARPSEVVFCASGTESDNLAVKGIWWARRAADPRRTRILASAVEHHAVLDAVEWLATHEGATVEWLEVDAQGLLHPDVLAEAIERNPSDVAIVTVMWANNEVGTVQPVRQLVDLAHQHGIPFHSDAVQAVGQLPVDVGASGVDALTLTGHKFGGPLGVGALVLGRDIACVPLLHGGGQERDVRSGTLDTPAVAGLAVAAQLAVERQPELLSR